MTNAERMPDGETLRTDKAVAVIYAGDYLNKLMGEKIERESRDLIEAGCRALVINFRNTELVNSIGVSLLLGVIEVVERAGARLFFTEVNSQTEQLFEMLGLLRHAQIIASAEEAANG